MRPRLLDLFSGYGGFSMGFERAGFETVAFSEIEPLPCGVLARRWPGVPNLGDIRGWRSWPWGDMGPIDAVTFGSPCQDVSVAGRRAGLGGERSSLFYEAVGVVRRSGARYAVWENVPGAFSSNGGWDFASVLDAMADAGALDICWRVLDAQWFGVPQRRRRVFLVADFGGERAGEVLFEPEGVPGHLEAGGGEGQEAAGGAGGGSGTAGRFRYQLELGNQGSGGNVGGEPPDVPARTLDTNGPPGVVQEAAGMPVRGVAPALRGSDPYGDHDGAEGHLVFGANRQGGEQALGNVPTKNRQDFETETLVTHALTAEGHDASEDGSEAGRGTPLVPAAFNRTAGHDIAYTLLDASPTLKCGSGLDIASPPAVAFAPLAGREGGAQPEVSGERSSALRGAGGGSSRDYVAAFESSSCEGARFHGNIASTQSAGGYSGSTANQPRALRGMAVRRLTPLECERLQGLPDGWTDVWVVDERRGRVLSRRYGAERACIRRASDAERYRALGNGVAVPVVEWIARRMRPLLGGRFAS